VPEPERQRTMFYFSQKVILPAIPFSIVMIVRSEVYTSERSKGILQEGYRFLNPWSLKSVSRAVQHLIASPPNPREDLGDYRISDHMSIADKWFSWLVLIKSIGKHHFNDYKRS
jgi:hypothetical protein